MLSIVQRYSAAQVLYNRMYSSILTRSCMEKAELETTITYNMEERLVRLFSAIKRDQTKLRKAGFAPTYGTAARGYGYEVPLTRLKWRITSGVKSRRGFAKKAPSDVHTTIANPSGRT